MKKLILTVVFVLTFTPAMAGMYVSGNLGIAALNDSTFTDPVFPEISLEVESESGIAGTLAVGYGFKKARLEGELSYQKNDLDTISLLGLSLDAMGDLTSLALMANGYYDFKNISPVTPFISAGIGIAKVELNDFNLPGSGLPSYSADDTVLAYQIGGGIGIAATEKLTIDIKYRYFKTEDPKFDTVSAEYSSHNLYAGMRVSF